MKTQPNNDGASLGSHDRQPPQNIEAEQGVLGSCLLSPRMIDECAEILSPDDFFRASHIEIWAVVLAMRDRGDQVDFLLFCDELNRLGRYTAIGGDAYLREIVDSVPHAANAVYYAKIVRERAVSRQLLDAATETIREIYSHQHTASELVRLAEERVFAVGEADAGQTWDANVLMDETMARLQARRDGVMASGLATGFLDIDGMTGGLQAGAMTVLAARPSQGKTSLALDITRHVAGAGMPVLFVSLEMSRIELGDRLLAAESGVSSGLIRDARHMSDRHRQAASNAVNKLCGMKFRIDDTASKTMSQIAAQARRTKHRHGLALIVVDYLGLIDGQRQKGESRQEEVAKISRAMKTMARSLNVPVLALHQLNRKSEDREGRRPMLADLRDSGQIEADADLVLLLHRPEFYDPNDQPGIAELFVAKNRNGATGTIRLVFQGACTRFNSLSTVAEVIPDAYSPY